jgi:hypothetical protein
MIKKLNYTILDSDPLFSQCRIPAISKAYKKHEQLGFVLGDEGKATNLWVCGT